MLKYYWTWLYSKVGEPFYENFSGGSAEVKLDSMCPTRCLILLHAAVIAHQMNFNSRYFVINGVKIPLILAYIEMIQYIFNDPWANTLNLKKNTGTLKEMLAALAPIGKGQVIRWNMNRKMQSFVVEGVRVNDKISYLSQLKNVTKELEALKDAGLVNFAQWYVAMIQAEITPENMAQCSLLTFIETAASFFRGNAEPAHIAQKEAGEEKVAPNDPPYKYFLANEYSNALVQYSQLIPSYEEFLSQIFGGLTTKSSGGYSSEWSFKLGGEIVSFKSTDKILAFLRDPEFFLDPETVKRELTDDFKGQIFKREVPARGTRAVFAMPLAYYLLELILGDLFLYAQLKDPEFTLGDQVNQTLSDHSWGAYASSDPETLIVGQDFSAFDSFQKWANMRQYALQGVLDGLARTGKTGPFGPWSSIGDVFKLLWEKTKSAVFETGDTVLVTDQMNSGEKFTIMANNYTNRANFQIEKQMLQRDPRTEDMMTPERIELVVNYFMGDDSVQIYKLKGGSFSLEELIAFREVISEASELNGMKLNADKVVVRLTMYNYLKKAFCQGYSWPRGLQIQTMTSERITTSSNVVEILASYASLLNEAISRGYSHDYNRFMYFQVALLKSSVRVRGGQLTRTGDTKVGRFTKLPISIAYTPSSLGGTGVVPHSMIGANKDIIWPLVFDGATLEYMNLALWLNEKPRDIKSEIARAIVRDGQAKKGWDFLRKHRDRVRGKSAAEAVDYLTSKGIDIGDFSKLREHDRLVHATIRDSPKLASIVDREHYGLSSLILDKKAMLDANPKQDPINIVINKELDRIFVIKNVTNDKVRCVSWHMLTRRTVETGVAITDEIRDLFLSRANKICNRNGRLMVIISKNPILDEYELLSRSDAVKKINRIKTPKTELVPRIIDIEFEWLMPFHIQYDGPLGYAIPKEAPQPIAGLDDHLADRMKRVGVSGEGDELSVNAVSLLADLMKDRKMPRDLTVDKIFKVISRPDISHDVTLIAATLRAAGASAENALSVANKFFALSERYSFLDRTGKYSTQDQVMGHMDRSIRNYHRIVDVDYDVGNAFSRVLISVGALASITEDPNITTKHVTIKIQGDKIEHAKSLILGGRFNRVNLYWDGLNKYFLEG
jgi:hypothetical protein